MRISDWSSDVCSSDLALLKVDVEGAEGMVFAGAERTLKEHRPVVLAEFSRPLLLKNGSSPEAIITLFERCGYGVRNPFRSGRPGSVEYDEIIGVPMQGINQITRQSVNTCHTT